MRRFPPPWSIEELDACFVVKDHSGQKLGYFNFEEEPGRRSATKLLTLLEGKSFALPGDVVEDVRRKFGAKRGQHRRS
jgi:hypothetical protein